jgi:amino acid transporter
MLERRLSLLQAVSVNMSLMVGIGPFITIPLLIASMNGPQSMIGWVVGAIVAVCDGMVWSELAAAFPGSGGTYHFYDSVYGNSRTGRLLKFVFVWQFLFSGPLEVTSGAIGLAKYLGYFFPSLASPAWHWRDVLPFLPGTVAWDQLAAMGVMVLVTVLAYRRIAAAGRLMVVLWAGMLITVGWVIVTALTHFDRARAFDFPKMHWGSGGLTFAAMGGALTIAMYDLFGYYQVCYLGDEVADAPRNIPRSILISVMAVSVIYLVMNVGILGVIPWRDVVTSQHIASDLMLKVHGTWAAGLATAMIIWTALASVYSALLGYSRVPYASARAGHFFKLFAATHPAGNFPHRALLLMSGLATVACLADLESVIKALVTSRILIQFVGQIATVFYLRAQGRAGALNFRMPLFPLPALIALAGWLFIFFMSDTPALIYGIASLIAGVVAFFVFTRTEG